LERLNGTIRQHVAPLHRKTRSFAKCRTALDTQTQLFKSYYDFDILNWVLPSFWCKMRGSLLIGGSPLLITVSALRLASIQPRL